MKYWAGIDLGGTNIVCGLVDEDLNLLGKLKQPTEAAKGSGFVLERMAAMVKQLLEETGIPLNELQGVGIGCPGFINPEDGVCMFAGNLGWRDLPVAHLLSAKLQVPVFIDNDVRMYVFGEAAAGAARGYKHLLGITLGTGLAAAMVNTRHLYYGGGYMAGELGHIHMEGEHRKCGCGMSGCLETVASATGIVKQVQEVVRTGATSVLQEWLKDEKLDALTSADVSKAYDAGDAVAVQVMQHTGTLLGRGLAYAVTLYSPDALIIGGGAALAGERLFKPMREELKLKVYPGYWERLHIHQGELIDDGGVIGSAAFAQSQVQPI